VVAGNIDYFDLGINLFNQEEYFLAHECFENIWKKLPKNDVSKQCFQALIQTAVGCYHLKNNNYKESLAQFYKASIKLENYLPLYNNLDIFTLHKNISSIINCLNGNFVDIAKCNLVNLKLKKQFKEM